MSTSSGVGPTSNSVEEFIASNDLDGSLARLDAVITGALPGVTPVLWQGRFWGGTEQSIIGYGNIAQPRPRGRTVSWFLIGLARQKNYLSLYVNATEDGLYLSKTYGPRLGKTKIGSASVSFTSADHIDLGVLEEMVRRAARLTKWS